MKQKPTCFIIEEPEVHLYPNSQKEAAEFIHSPYILGTLSNLLDAQRMLTSGKRSDFLAFFVDGGEIHEAIDSENGLVRNELIDGASDKINGFADDLLYLEREGKK